MQKSMMLLAGFGFVVVGCSGGADDPTIAAGTPDAVRTIEIEMRDIEFAPDTISVRSGERVRFVFTNSGSLVHDAFIGDLAAQDAHGSAMDEMSEMDGMSEEANSTNVDPGGDGSLEYTFTEDETIRIGCHEPGHYEAGMFIDVEVS